MDKPVQIKNMPRYKVIFIGDQAVGKTSIVSRFVYETFSIAHQPTIGIDFISKVVSVNDQLIRLQLWDTAGQERFRSLIPSYMRDAKVAIITYDVSVMETFNNVQVWLDYIREEGTSDIIQVLVANKIDLVEDRVVTTEEGQKLASQQEMIYFEVSALDGINIQSMFKSIGLKLFESQTSVPKNETPRTPVLELKPETKEVQQEKKKQQQKQCC